MMDESQVCVDEIFKPARHCTLLHVGSLRHRFLYLCMYRSSFPTRPCNFTETNEVLR